MKCFFCPLILMVCAAALGQTSKVANADQARFFKCENGVSAHYLELAANNTYRVIAREHMGIWQVEQGRWKENGSTITFTPSSHMRGGKAVKADGKSYDATDVQYKSNTFLAFKSDDAAGIAISLDKTKHEMDSNPQSLPLHVFFKTTAKVVAQETKLTYPFSNLKLDK